MAPKRRRGKGRLTWSGREGGPRHRFARTKRGPHPRQRGGRPATPGARCRFSSLSALAGCAPVGPNFLKPAAIVSPEFKEIKGWKVATPRASEPKGDWWAVFHDPELEPLEAAVAISNQTLKADEANYRQALALINEARAGLFPTVNGTGSATRSSTAGTILTAEASGTWTLDVWGEVRREIEAQQAGAESSAANLANATLAEQSALALAYVQVREADSLEDLLTRTVDEYKRSLTITQNQYNAGPPRSPTSSRPRRRCSTPRRSSSPRRHPGAERARDRGPDGPAARRPFGPARAALDPYPLDPGQRCHRRCSSAGPTSRRPRRRCARTTPRSGSPSPAISRRCRSPASSAIPAILSPRASARPIRSGRSAASLAQPLFNGGLTGAQVEAARQTYDARSRPTARPS